MMNTPARPSSNPPSAPSYDQWADELLGFDTVTTQLLPQRSIEAEVEAYLLDSQVGTSSVSFWQVSYYVSVQYPLAADTEQ